MSDGPVVVVGAGGMLGGEIARQLLAAGVPARATARDANRLAKLAALGAEVCALDLTRPADIPRVLEGAQAVVSSVHGLKGGSGRNSLASVDLAGQCSLIDAARVAGVECFVLISAQGADRAATSPFLRAKAEVEAYLAASGLAWTVIRPSAFAELYADQLIGAAVRKGGTAWLVGDGDTPRNYVSIKDVAEIVVRAVRSGVLTGRVIAAAGTGNPTQREIAGLYASGTGAAARVRSVPSGLVRGLAALLRPFHGVHALLDFLAESADVDLTADPDETAAILGRPPRSVAEVELDARGAGA